MNHELLKSILRYEPDTGDFYWIAGNKAGIKAGFGELRGRIQICISGKNYYAHRLAWLYCFGVMPSGVIDHKNGNSLDNRIQNLRDTDQTGNLGNQRKAKSDNKSGLLGVSEKRGRWRAAICVNKKTIHIGTFDSKEEAHQKYLEKKREVHSLCTI